MGIGITELTENLELLMQQRMMLANSDNKNCYKHLAKIDSWISAVKDHLEKKVKVA